MKENYINKLDTGVKYYYRKIFSYPDFGWHKICIFGLGREKKAL